MSKRFLLLGLFLLPAYLPAQQLLVANQFEHSLTIIDPAAHKTLSAAGVDISGQEVAVSPDGKLAYVPVYGNSRVGKPGTDGRTLNVVDLAAGRTIAHKTPEQLAEVARAAVLLDGVKHMVMTTGTPNATDRGAAVLCESAFAVKTSVDLPIQAQCEPPDNDRWFERMKASGIDTLGQKMRKRHRAIEINHRSARSSCRSRSISLSFITGFRAGTSLVTDSGGLIHPWRMASNRRASATRGLRPGAGGPSSATTR